MQFYKELEKRHSKISRLNDVRSILHWDEAVVMPEGASDTRNQAMAELSVLIQELGSSQEIGEWLEKAEGEPLDEWQKANIREMRRQYVEQTAVPAELNRKLTIARMTCEQSWRTLRAENNWKGLEPHLQNVLDLTREMLGELSQVVKLPLYDTALGQFSPGLNSETVEKLFGDLRKFLPTMIQEAVEKQKSKRLITPKGKFPMVAQKALAKELMELVGFSSRNGRLDESHHPFCGGTPRDVRITTRYSETEFVSSLMGVLHETGHALYEQNLPDAWLGQPVGNACGMSVHESQSLFMEMQVCRSREFLEFATPYIQKHLKPFTENPESLSADNLAALTTEVETGFIRVDADEVTYPAHIILRFEIERDLIEGRLKLSDLPEAWNAKMKQLLGLTTLGNDKNGCMQDVHWPSGSFGYFPAYTFGAVIAAQLFSTLEKQSPQTRSQITKGDFAPMQDWLRTKVWNQASKLTTLELVTQASKPLSSQDFEQHLRNRYLG